MAQYGEKFRGDTQGIAGSVFFKCPDFLVAKGRSLGFQEQQMLNAQGPLFAKLDHPGTLFSQSRVGREYFLERQEFELFEPIKCRVAGLPDFVFSQPVVQLTQGANLSFEALDFLPYRATGSCSCGFPGGSGKQSPVVRPEWLPLAIKDLEHFPGTGPANGCDFTDNPGAFSMIMGISLELLEECRGSLALGFT